MQPTKPNTAFWIIAVIALLWNLLGVFQFVTTTFMFDMVIEGLPAEEVEFYNSIPGWYTIVFGIATISGLLASILLLMRKKLAVALFGISLITVLIIQFYWIFGTDVMEVIGTGAIAMPLIVIAIAIFLYFYSKGAARNGWLR